MDSEGRLHMPGFVGQTFDETGLRKKLAETRAQFSELEKDVRQPGRGEAAAESRHGKMDLIAAELDKVRGELAARYYPTNGRA